MTATPSDDAMRDPQLGRTRTMAFAVTTGIWIVGWAAMLQPGQVVGEFLFGLMIAVMFAGGFITGKWGGGGWRTGAAVGFFSATINLLLVGALIDSQDHLASAALWVGGLYVASIVIVAAGAALGVRGHRPDATPPNWYGLLFLVAAVTVLMLLISGGVVTGMEAGMAFPDWPRSEGHNMFLLPLATMTSESGKYVEHSHRLYGALVGLTAIMLTITAWQTDRRRWFKVLTAVLLVMVCAQGVVGALRVLDESYTFAIIHGVSAQLVFATFVALAVFTARRWCVGAPAEPHPGAGTDGIMTAALVGLLVLQLAVGASFRHLHTEGEAPTSLLAGLLHGHIFVAVLVLVAALFSGMRGLGVYRDERSIQRTAALVLGVTVVQVLLGVVAFIVVPNDPRTPGTAIPTVEIVITTLHQATGAMLLASAVALALWTRRCLKAIPNSEAAIA